MRISPRVGCSSAMGDVERFEWVVEGDAIGARLDRFSRRHAESSEQPLHVAAEAVMLDLKSVPGRVFPLEAMADIGRGTRL